MNPPAPHTLTREQFHHERPHGSYSAYQRYVTSKRKQRTAAGNQPIDPFAPVSENQLQKRASIFGPTMNDQQIQKRAGTEAQAQVSPLLKMITDQINRQSGAEQQHLAGATQNYQQQVAQYAPQVQQAYGQAEQSQAGINAALAQSLQGGGQQLAGELEAKLAQINAPQSQVQQVAGGAAQAGVGAGNAQLGQGSAELSRLLAHGTAAQEYGAKLPGIAAAEGLQRSGEIANRYTDQFNDRTAEVNAALPGLIQNLTEGLQSRNENRQQNKAGLIDSERNRMLQGGIARQSGLVDQSQIAETQRTHRVAEHETAREHRTAEQQRSRALDQAAAALGLNRAELDAKLESQAETSRHNRAQEQKDAARLGISVQELRERRRHNKASEKNQGKSKSKGTKAAPWSDTKGK